MSEPPLRVLVLSRNYPNSILSHQGPWVARQTRALALRHCEVTVLAPTPYCPPLPGPADIVRLRRIERHSRDEALEIFHPRFLTGPGITTEALDGVSMYVGVRDLGQRLHAKRQFDVIHAHFSYPDGAAAVALGRRFGVPVVITEHVLWKPWMDNAPMVRRQATWAASNADRCVGVSDAVRKTMRSFVGERRIDVIPIGVDGEVFRLKDIRPTRSGEERLLFVGWINYIKGIDVLLDSMRTLVKRRPGLHLTIVGGALFRHKRVQQEELLAKVRHFGLESAITFAGPQSADGVARFMRESDALVLPSRRESCGSVLLEALASGIPVIATRCGGPEEIVTGDVGVLTAVADSAALAAGIEEVLDRRSEFDPERLRDYALRRFSWTRLADEYVDIYRSVIH